MKKKKKITSKAHLFTYLFQFWGSPYIQRKMAISSAETCDL